MPGLVISAYFTMTPQSVNVGYCSGLLAMLSLKILVVA